MASSFLNIPQTIKKCLFRLLYRKHPGCICDKRLSPILLAEDIYDPDEPLIFSHCGGLGDILFSLYFCREFARYFRVKSFGYHIFTTSERRYGMCLKTARFIEPLLVSQDFISHVSVGELSETHFIDLDDFRKLKINFMSGDIRRWYYNLSGIHFQADFSEPVIVADKDSELDGKLLINLTSRNVNAHIDMNYLAPFQDHLVFIGTEQEHCDFVKNFFELPYQPCKDMLQMAQYMAGAKGFIGNQSGIYSLAECMKIPRILLAPDFVNFHGVIIPGPHNNHPIGGWSEDVISSAKMIAAVNALLKKE